MRSRYFIKITKSNAPKNSLQKELQKSVEHYNDYLLWNVSVSDFHKTIQDEVERLNNVYQRCAPLILKTFKNNGKIEMIYIDDLITFSIYTVKQIL